MADETNRRQFDEEPSANTDPAVQLANHLDRVVLTLMQPRQEAQEEFWTVAMSALAEDGSFNPDAAFNAVAHDIQLENVVDYVRGIRSQVMGELTAHPGEPLEIDLRYVSPSDVTERARAKAQPLIEQIGGILQAHIPEQDILSDVMQDMQGLFNTLETISSANTAGGEQMGRTAVLQSLGGMPPLNVNSGILLQSGIYRPFFPADVQISPTVTATALIPSKIDGVQLKVDVHGGQIARESLVIQRSTNVAKK
jgi:hypothetical protein